MFIIVSQKPSRRGKFYENTMPEFYWKWEPRFGMSHSRKALMIHFLKSLMPELENQSDEDILWHWPSVRKLQGVKTISIKEHSLAN